jgi:single-strand DNA-binding protein
MFMIRLNHPSGSNFTDRQRMSGKYFFTGWRSPKTFIMNAMKNKVQLIGNLGNKPEIKTTETGKKLARFSIATSETYRNAKGDKVTETQWHNLVAWEKMAEIVEKYLDKGSEVAIDGKLINRSYSDKEGNKKYISEVLVHELLMFGQKAEKKEVTV